MFKIKTILNIIAVSILIALFPAIASANITHPVAVITSPEKFFEAKSEKKQTKTAKKSRKPKVLFITRGYASTYGNDPVTGVTDPYDNNIPALSGATNNKPGFAYISQKTLGGYWKIKAPNGRSAIIQQTDIGPAKWTGKTFDINAVAVRKHFKYRQGNNFPTKKGTWRGEYLGKKYRG